MDIKGQISSDPTPATPSTPLELELSSKELELLKSMRKFTPLAFKKLQVTLRRNRGGAILEYRQPNGWKRSFSMSGEKLKWISESGGETDLVTHEILSTVFLLEGESDFMAAIEIGMTSLATGTGGSGTFKSEWAKRLAGKEIYIAFDNDEAGVKGARNAADILLEVGCVPHILRWPTNFPLKFDLRDFINDGEKQSNEVEEFIKRHSDLYLGNGDFCDDVSLDENGLFYERKTKGGNTQRLFVCSPLRAISESRSHGQADWGKEFIFKDPDGSIHRVSIQNSEIIKGTAIELLVKEGLRVSSKAISKEKLNDYLMRSEAPARYRTTVKSGFHGSCYVTESGNLGKCPEPIRLQAESPFCLKIETSGSLSDWRDEIGSFAYLNSNLAVAICTALAGPIVSVMEENNFGINFYGPSSIGKTTCLETAASALGKPEKNPDGIVHTWRFTSNSAESIALGFNDSTLFLDEMGQCDPQQLSETVYQLGNGQGKGRALKSGMGKSRKIWRNTYISTSEESLKTLLAKKNLVMKGGQQIRMVDIYCQVSDEFGAFESTGRFGSSGELVAHLRRASRLYYGTPMKVYIEGVSKQLHENALGLESKLKDRKKEFISKCTNLSFTSYHQRLVSQFGVLFAAGILSKEFGILNWQDNDLSDMLIGTLQRVIQRIGVLQSEDRNIISQIQEFIQKFELSRFEDNPASDTLNPNVAELSDETLPNQRLINRAGHVAFYDGKTAYFFYREVFQNEVIKGFDYDTVRKVLDRHKLIFRDSEGKFSINKTVRGEQTRFIVIPRSILAWSGEPSVEV